MPSVKRDKPVAKKKKVSKAPPKRGGSVLDRIQPIGFDRDSPIRINIYGKSGTGKTTLWGTFPGTTLAIIASGGTKDSGELLSLDTPENRKRISSVVLENPEEFEDLLRYQEKFSKYNNIVLDHASGLQDLVLRDVLGIKELPAQKSWGLASRSQYGEVALKTKEYLRHLLDMTNSGANVIIVAQERDFSNEGDDSSEDHVMPFIASALSPSVVGWLNPAVDFIVNTFIRKKTKEVVTKVGTKKIKTVKATGEVEFCLRTAPDAIYATKFRTPKGKEVPSVLVDPTYEKIISLIRG